MQHPQGAPSSGCSILWVHHPQGAASSGCSILWVHHPQGAASSAFLWVSIFNVLAEGSKMAPSGLPNDRKWASYWPMCSREVLLPKSEGAASSGCTILRVHHPQGAASSWCNNYSYFLEILCITCMCGSNISYSMR